MSKHTPGPWCIWDGPSYVGGGRDLCIGAGKTWLANMDHRNCENRDCHIGTCKNSPCAGEPHTSICTIDTEITEEQEANARLIAAAPELLAACIAASRTMNALGDLGDETYKPLRKAHAIVLAAIAMAEGREVRNR